MCCLNIENKLEGPERLKEVTPMIAHLGGSSYITVAASA